MNLALGRLFLRRALSPWLGVCLAAVGACLVWVEEIPRSAVLGLDPERAEQVLRGLLRGSVWTLLPLVLVLVSVSAAARDPERWRRGEGLVLGTRRAPPWRVATSVWAGRTLGLVLWTLAIAAAGELGAAGSAPCFEIGPRESLSAARPAAAGGAFSIELAGARDLPPGSRARLSWYWLGDYSSLETVHLKAWRTGSETTRTRAQSALVQHIEIDLPTGSGPLQLQVTTVGAESALAIGGLVLEYLHPAPERLGTWRLLVALAWFGATLLALAAGLGAWISAPSSVALLTVTWCAAWIEGALEALPGLALPRMLRSVSAGHVPQAEEGAVWFVGALLISLGLALRVLALRRGLVR
jgi:hypothetical protein